MLHVDVYAVLPNHNTVILRYNTGHWVHDQPNALWVVRVTRRRRQLRGGGGGGYNLKTCIFTFSSRYVLGTIIINMAYFQVVLQWIYSIIKLIWWHNYAPKFTPKCCLFTINIL